MVYSSQLERYTAHPVLNLGFSGHGLMQLEVARILGSLDAALYILDCEYNMVSAVGLSPHCAWWASIAL